MTEALSDTRVVTLNGARQTGKSTLARIAARQHPNALMRLLDDPATLRAARDDPAGFVEHDGLLVIDEVQLAPELFRSIKVAVDTDPRPGQFLLTGSAQVLALRELPDALPGRMEIVELWPFSQGELERSPDAFVDAAFASGPTLSRTSVLRAPRRPSPAAGPARRPIRRAARPRHTRHCIRHPPDHAEPLPRTAFGGLPHQADPCLVSWPDPAGHRHAQAGLCRYRHCRSPARPGHRAPG